MEIKEILEEIQGGIIVVDLEGSLLFANKYARELVHVGEKELKKRKITDFYKNPEQRKEFLAQLKKEGRVKDFEIAIMTLKGEEKTVLANSVLIKFENKDASLTSFTDITQRKKLESELKNSKNFVETILNSVDESVMVIDREKRIVEVNQQWVNAFGKSREEVIGKNCFEVVHHFKEPCPFCIAAEVFETGTSVKIAREARLPGKSMYIEISAYPLKENGKITKVAEIVRDITIYITIYKDAEKRLEKLVEEKTSFLTSVINSITDPIIVIDRDYKLLELNNAALAVLGKKKNEVLEKQCFTAFFGKSQPCEWCQCMEAFKKGKPAYGRVELKDEKGNMTYWDDYAYPVMENGKVTKLIEVVKNVTDRIALEEKYKILFENSADAVFVADASTKKITDANKTAQVMLGYSKNELIGIEPKQLFQPQFHGKLEEKYKLLITKRSMSCEDLKISKKTGELIDIEMSCSLVKYDTQGSILIIIRDITERKKAEKALEESEKKYRNIVDNALVGVCKTTLKGDILYANKALLDMLEFDSVEEAAKEGALARYKNKKDREALIEKLKKDGKVVNFEFEMLTKTGKTKNVLLSAALEGAALSGMIRDMTEYKKAQEEIIESEKRFKQLFDSAPEGFVMLELPLLKIADCDKSFPEIVKRGREEVLKMSLFEILGEENREKLKNVIKKALEEGSNVVLFEFPVEGEKKVLRFSFVKVRYKEREVIAAIVSDITREKAVEKEIVKVKDFLSSVITNSGDSIVTTAFDGRITSWNRGAEEIFGYSESEMLGNLIYDIYPEELKSRRKEFADILLGGERIKNEKVRIISKSRGMVWISLTMDLLKDTEGKPTGIVGISKDITKEREAEEKLKKTYDDLEKRTKEIEKINKLMVGREIRMIELKNRIKELEETLKAAKGGKL